VPFNNPAFFAPGFNRSSNFHSRSFSTLLKFYIMFT
jgi:hypothetical protein